VSESTATALVDAYLAVLEQNPHFHDKLEFDIAFTVLSPVFDEDVESRLVPHGVTVDQIGELREGLREITQSAFGRFEEDLEPIENLSHRRDLVCEGRLNPLDKAVALLEDCRRFGTLAFSHAARGGFIAADFLQGLVRRGAIGEAERQKFLGSIKTVAGKFEDDARRVSTGEFSKEEYVRIYGHLRPGTYDLTVPAYWEAPERYLFPRVLAARADARKDVEWPGAEAPERVNQVFQELGLDLDADQFFRYARRAIEGREAAKFEFTRNLSRGLDFICEFGNEIGVERDAIAFLQYEDLSALKTGALTVGSIREVIEQRRQDAVVTSLAELPQLLFRTQDFFCFERAEAQPNFVTSKSIEASAVTWSAGADHSQLEARIILIEQADPGCDWLFAHNIAGLITKYGGANSHMAIRAAELDLPAAIGVGDLLYEQLVGASMIRLDCGNCRIRRID
jgi:phosphohistidine swiveling domain-containing protein